MEGEGYLVWTKETVVTISWKSNKKDGTVRDAGPKGDLMGLIVRVGKSRDFLWICYDFVSRHLPPPLLPPSGSGFGFVGVDHDVRPSTIGNGRGTYCDPEDDRNRRARFMFVESMDERES